MIKINKQEIGTNAKMHLSRPCFYFLSRLCDRDRQHSTDVQDIDIPILNRCSASVSARWSKEVIPAPYSAFMGRGIPTKFDMEMIAVIRDECNLVISPWEINILNIAVPVSGKSQGFKIFRCHRIILDLFDRDRPLPASRCDGSFAARIYCPCGRG